MMEPLFDIGFCTDKGNRRARNEDSCTVIENLGLCIVADGMGGHEFGDVASQMAIALIEQQVKVGKSLADSIYHTHHLIQEVSINKHSSKPMGTTIVAALFSQRSYQISWVGDSRAYLNDEHLSQLTRDHSLVQRLLDNGVVSQEEAKTHPNRNVITQSLGSIELKELKVDSVFGDLKAGQKLLLCSDGLNSELSDQEISELLSGDASAQVLSENLMAAAKGAGGKDNISVIVISYPAARLNADETIFLQ